LFCGLADLPRIDRVDAVRRRPNSVAGPVH